MTPPGTRPGPASARLGPEAAKMLAWTPRGHYLEPSPGNGFWGIEP